MGQSNSVNLAIIVGWIGRDPQYETDKEGANHRVKLSIATNEVYYTEDEKRELKEFTQWHVVWAKRKLATIVREHFRKGMLVYVRGMVKYGYRKVEGEDDIKYTYIEADEMQILLHKRPEKRPDPF